MTRPAYRSNVWKRLPTTLQPWTVFGGYRIAAVTPYLTMAGWDDDHTFVSDEVYPTKEAAKAAIEELER